MSDTRPDHVAHIITGRASAALGRPAVLIMDRFDHNVITKITIGVEADLPAALTRLRLVELWDQVGEPVEVQAGYWVVDVKRAAKRVNYPLAHNTSRTDGRVPVVLERPNAYPFAPGERERDWHPASPAELAAYQEHWDGREV